MKKFLNKNNIFSGLRLRQILNDLKRRPEDAAKDLFISHLKLQKILDGKAVLDLKLVTKITSIWPIKITDIINPYYDKEPNFKIMRAVVSKQTKRVMSREGIDYYEYRDTVMSKNAPFRPEWIRQLSYVNDNTPTNKALRWNRGHLLHQFTYFVGEVNFYYFDKNNKKRTAVMNTGDTMYIGPYVPHTFATRNKNCNGFIIAITFLDKITTEIQNELLDYGRKKSLMFFESKANNSINKVTVLKYNKAKLKKTTKGSSTILKTKELASTKLAKSAKSYEIEVMKNNKLKQSSFAHQYIYVLSKNGSIKIENKDIRVKCNDTIYIKPLTEHYFSSKGLKILILSVDSKINQDAKLQLNQIGKKNLDRIIYDDTAWFKR